LRASSPSTLTTPRSGSSAAFMGRDRTDVAAKRKALAVGSQGLITVMRGQKRVEDARKRAYHPRIHLLRKKLFQD
jgi:hypothetical protein